MSHVANKPSVVMLSVSRAPFEGSLRSMHFRTHLNPTRKEIVSFQNMIRIIRSALEEAYHATIRERKKLPEAIWVFRLYFFFFFCCCFLF